MSGNTKGLITQIAARAPRSAKDGHYAPNSTPNRPSERPLASVLLDGIMQKCTLTCDFASRQPMWRFAESRVEMHGTA